MESRSKLFLFIAVVMAILVASTAAWADSVTGAVYRVPGNLLNAGDPTTMGGTLEGSFTSNGINFSVSGSGTLANFLNSGGANYGAMSGLSDPMSNCPTYASTNCYSTALSISGQAYFANGTTYTFTHDDGMLMYIAGNLFINAPGPVVATPSGGVFTGTTGVYDYQIFYMATNGNPEVLTASRTFQPVPEPASMALLGSGLLGLAGTLRRKFLR